MFLSKLNAPTGPANPNIFSSLGMFTIESGRLYLLKKIKCRQDAPDTSFSLSCLCSLYIFLYYNSSFASSRGLNSFKFISLFSFLPQPRVSQEDSLTYAELELVRPRPELPASSRTDPTPSSPDTVYAQILFQEKQL